MEFLASRSFDSGLLSANAVVFLHKPAHKQQSDLFWDTFGICSPSTCLCLRFVFFGLLPLLSLFWGLHGPGHQTQTVSLNQPESARERAAEAEANWAGNLDELAG